MIVAARLAIAFAYAAANRPFLGHDRTSRTTVCALVAAPVLTRVGGLRHVNGRPVRHHLESQKKCCLRVKLKGRACRRKDSVQMEDQGASTDRLAQGIVDEGPLTLGPQLW